MNQADDRETKTRLLAAAALLVQPVLPAVREFTAQQESVAAALTRAMSARPDLERLIGADNQAMMADNSRNFMRFMAALLEHYQPLVLVETAIWAFTTYRSHGFNVAYWPANLDTLLLILKETLTPDAYDATGPFFNWLIINIPALTALSDVLMKKSTIGPMGHS